MNKKEMNEVVENEVVGIEMDVEMDVADETTEAPKGKRGRPAGSMTDSEKAARSARMEAYWADRYANGFVKKERVSTGNPKGRPAGSMTEAEKQARRERMQAYWANKKAEK